MNKQLWYDTYYKKVNLAKLLLSDDFGVKCYSDDYDSIYECEWDSPEHLARMHSLQELELLCETRGII